MNKEIGKRLRMARERRNLTQKEAANLCGLIESQISHYETGDRGPSLKNIIKLTKVYGVSLEWIVGRLDNMTVTSFNDPLAVRVSNLSTENRRLVLSLVKAMEKHDV